MIHDIPMSENASLPLASIQGLTRNVLFHQTGKYYITHLNIRNQNGSGSGIVFLPTDAVSENTSHVVSICIYIQKVFGVIGG